MANILLSTLANYWKTVSDWVKGTDTTSAPKVTASIVGSLASGVTDALPVQLSGSIIARTSPVPVQTVGNTYIIDTLANAVSVAAGGKTDDLDLGLTNEREAWVLVSIDKQPWTLAGGHLLYPLSDGGAYAFYPIRNNQTTTHSITGPCFTFYMGTYVPETLGQTPATLKEAKEFKMPYRSGIKIKVVNGHATDTATITVKILRIWG